MKRTEKGLNLSKLFPPSTLAIGKNVIEIALLYGGGTKFLTAGSDDQTWAPVNLNLQKYDSFFKKISLPACIFRCRVEKYDGGEEKVGKKRGEMNKGSGRGGFSSQGNVTNGRR